MLIMFKNQADKYEWKFMHLLPAQMTNEIEDIDIDQ